MVIAIVAIPTIATMMPVMVTTLRRRRQSTETADEKNDPEKDAQLHVVISPLCPCPAFQLLERLSPDAEV